MKLAKRIVLVLVILFVAIQFLPKSLFPLTNPAADPADRLDANARALRPEVNNAMYRACRDCHSNNTVWPWYSKVAPVSWLLSSDVTEGRKELNFSEWKKYPPKRAARKLQEVCEQLRRGEMPPWYYLPMHPAAKLSDAEKKAICEWTAQERAALPPIPPGPSGEAGQQH